MRAVRNSRQTIARQLTRVQRELDALGKMIGSFDPHLPDDEVSADWIRGLVLAKQRRDSIFPGEGFGDPGWDLLLELYSVALAGGQIATSELGTAAAIAPSTALRWLAQLEQSGLIERTRDRGDRRRLFVSLSPKGRAAMDEYFGRRES